MNKLQHKRNFQRITVLGVLVAAFINGMTVYAADPPDYGTSSSTKSRGGTWEAHVYDRVELNSEHLDSDGKRSVPVYGYMGMLGNLENDNYEIDIDGDGNKEVTFEDPELLRVKVTGQMAVVFVQSQTNNLYGGAEGDNQVREPAYLVSPKGTIENMGTSDVDVKVYEIEDLAGESGITWYKPDGTNQVHVNYVEDSASQITGNHIFMQIQSANKNVVFKDVIDKKANAGDLGTITAAQNLMTFSLNGKAEDTFVEQNNYPLDFPLTKVPDASDYVKNKPTIGFRIIWKFTKK